MIKTEGTYSNNFDKEDITSVVDLDHPQMQALYASNSSDLLSSFRKENYGVLKEESDKLFSLGIAQKRLNEIGQQKFEWHPTPKQETIDISSQILHLLGPSRIPDIVNPSPEGGIALEFFGNDHHTLIEIFDDLTAVMIEKNNGATRMKQFETNPLEPMLEYLNDAICKSA